MTSVFEAVRNTVYPFRYHGEMLVHELHGGVPSTPEVIEHWIKTKFQDNDALVQEMVLETMKERGLEGDEAVTEVASTKGLNGFKRTENGELYVEGRQLKACIKEAANIRWAKDRWGPTNKGTRGFFAEHVFVAENILPLGVKEPTGVLTSIVKSRFGTSFKLEEYVEDVTIPFTIVTDHEFTDEQWGQLWVTAEQQGFGASRSQGYGLFEITKWELDG